MENQNNNSPTTTMNSTSTMHASHSHPPVRRVYVSFTIPSLGRVHMEAEYDTPAATTNTSNITNNNDPNHTTSTINPTTTTHHDFPPFSAMFPMFMLLNQLSSMFSPMNSVESLRSHPAFAHLTTEQIQAFLNGGGNKPKPPASPEVVECLPRVRIQQQHVDNQQTCTVCMSEFELNELAIRLPCSHLFHSECITPWLKEHNQCANCRFELLTDDEEYNRNVVLKQAPPKIITTNQNHETNNTPSNETNNTNIEKDKQGDVVMGSSTIVELVEELKRQVSCSNKQAEIDAMELENHNNTNHATNNTNSDDSSVTQNSRQLKRKHNMVYSHSGHAVIEDITDRENEYNEIEDL